MKPFTLLIKPSGSDCNIDCAYCFYKKRSDDARRGRQVSNKMQTNGVLLDEEWCRFLNEKKFLLGISIDGPADTLGRRHENANRKVSMPSG